MPRPTHPAAHLRSRRALGIRATWCPHCKQPILRGLDAKVCALPATADAAPLTALGEAAALLAGRETFMVLVEGLAPARLQYRSPRHITRHPAGAPAGRVLAYDVVQAHECPNAPPPSLTTASAIRARGVDEFDPLLPPPY